MDSPPQRDDKNILSLLNETAEVTITDTRGIIRYANARFVETSGYSVDELVGSSHCLVKSDVHPSEFFAELWQTIEAGRTWKGLVCNRKKNGDLYWADATIIPLHEDGKIVEYAAIRHIVTNLVNLREQHRVSSSHHTLINKLLNFATHENELDAFLGYAIDIILAAPFCNLLPKAGVFLVDSETGELVLTCNKGFGDFIRKSCARVAPGQCLCGRALQSKKVVYKSCLDDHHETTYAEITPHGHYNVPILHDDSVLGVIVVYLPDGHPYSEIEVAFLEDAANAMAMVITRANYQAELVEARRQAESAYKVKSTFLSTMSHEIRTPLNAVVGIGHLLQDGGDERDQRDLLRTLMFSATHLTHLVNDILDFAKIESGNVAIEEVVFDIHLLLSTLERAYAFQTQDTFVTSSVEVAEELPQFLVGDPTRLNQILNNLMNNAVKFTEHGSIRLCVGVRGEKSGSLEVVFEVQDTGIGIRPENTDRIFERFSQEDSSTTRRFGGTGLGLDICRQLVELMGGELLLASRYGKGSTFSFSLMLKKASKAQLGETRALRGDVTRKDLTGVSVLVAEDNRVNALIISKFLERWNAEFEVCANGRLAVESLRRKDWQLVLMDINMPEMDGYEATQKILTDPDPRVRATPIIALTALILAEDVEKIKRAGMVDHITKPLDPDQLLRKILHYTEA